MSIVLDNPPVTTKEIEQARAFYQRSCQILGLRSGLQIMKRDGDKLKKRVDAAETDLRKLEGKLPATEVEKFKRRFVEMGERMDHAADFLSDPAFNKRDKTPEELTRLTEGERRGKEVMLAESEKLKLLCLEMEVAAGQKKGKDKKKEQKKLTDDRKRAWAEHLQACNSAISSLDELAPSEAARFGPQRDTAVNNMESSGLQSVELLDFDHLNQYEGLTSELAIVRRAAESAQINAASEKTGFDKLLKEIGKQVVKCENVCELAEFQDFTIQLEQFGQTTDFVIAAPKLALFSLEVNQQYALQVRMKSEYERREPTIYQESGPCKLRELEALGATFDYREYYSMYSRAHHQAALHNFKEGIRLLALVETEVGPRIESIRSAKEKWDELANDLIGAGDESGQRNVEQGKVMILVKTYTLAEQDKDIKPWTNKYAPEIRQELLDISFRAAKLGDYQKCCDMLSDLWNRKLGAGQLEEGEEEDEWSDDPAAPKGELQKQLLHDEVTRGEDQEKFDRYMRECDDAQFLYTQLQAKIDTMQSEWIGLDGQPLERESWDLPSITGEIEQARYLAGTKLQMKRGNALDAGIGEGRLILGRLSKQMNRLLSGSKETNSELRTLNLLEAAKAEHKQVTTAWESARKTAEAKLDELAQFGGDEYLTRLSEFEGLDKEIAAHEETIQAYFNVFPDLVKVAKAEDAKTAAFDGYRALAIQIAGEFTTDVEGSLVTQQNGLAAAVEAFKIAVAAAEQAHKDAKSRAGAWFDDSRTKTFFEGLQLELDEALAYGKLKGKEPQTTSIGALNAGEKLLQELKLKMDLIQENSFGDLKDLIKSTKSEIDREKLIKTYTPNTYKALVEKFQSKIVPDLSGQSPTEATKTLTEFKTKEIVPARNGAEEIRDIRAALPGKQTQIDRLIKERIEWVNENLPYDFPLDPPDLGSITGDYQGCVSVILRDQSPGLVRAADQRLDIIRDNRLNPSSDELSNSWPASCAKSITARDEQAKITAAEVDRVEKLRLFFMENKAGEYTQAKAFVKEHGGDKDLIKMIENSNKAVIEMLVRKEYASAENELLTMKQLAKDAMNSDSKKSKALAPLGVAFAQKVDKVDHDLRGLVTAIEKCKDDTTFTADQAIAVTGLIPASLTTRGIDATLFSKPLTTLDNSDAKRADRREAREQALQLVRDFKKILLEDPILQKLKGKNPFNEVGLSPLYAQLRQIEDAVVVTV